MLTHALPALLVHEGHGPEASLHGIIHWFSSPFHVLTTVIAVGVVFAILVAWGVTRRPAQELNRGEMVSEG